MLFKWFICIRLLINENVKSLWHVCKNKKKNNNTLSSETKMHKRRAKTTCICLLFYVSMQRECVSIRGLSEKKINENKVHRQKVFIDNENSMSHRKHLLRCWCDRIGQTMSTRCGRFYNDEKVKLIEENFWCK